MVAMAPSTLARPPAQGRSASRSASERRGATWVSPENDVSEQLARRHDPTVAVPGIGRPRPHRGDAHRARRRFSGQTHIGRYYRARYYHPQLQRFVSEDPIGFGGGDINLYAYVGNDPLNDTDPLGQFGLAGCGAGIITSLLFDAGGYVLSGRKPSFGEVLGNAAFGCASGAVGAGLVKLAPKILGPGSRLATRVFRLGGEPGVAGITLDQARAAAMRAGIDMRMFSLAFESGKNYGFISLTGSSAIVRDATGRFVLTLQQAALASERAAVQTIAHELNHIRGILQTGRVTSEVVAERAAQLAGWFFR